MTQAASHVRAPAPEDYALLPALISAWDAVERLDERSLQLTSSRGEQRYVTQWILVGAQLLLSDFWVIE